MVNSFRISGLYDCYDYDMDFRKLGKVSILTGPNGYGKTTILTILNNLISGRFVFLLTLPFKSMAVDFDSFSIRIEKKTVESKGNYDSDSGVAGNVTISCDESSSSSSGMPHTDSFTFDNRTCDGWEHYLEMGFSDKEDKLEWTFSDIAEIDPGFARATNSLRMNLNSLQAKFIEQQRLLEVNPSSRYRVRRRSAIAESGLRERVKGIASEIKDIYSSLSARYTANAQNIDSTFIDRLLKNRKVYSPEEYKEKIAEIKSKLKNLQTARLTDSIHFEEEYPEELRNTLSLYADDILQKLSVFDDSFEKLDRFMQVMGSKPFANKRMVLGPRFGLSFESPDGKTISLETLSSGEQNLLVLYYDLIFKTGPKSVVFVDEPENSLHVAWQKTIFDDYSKIAEENGIQVIMATHSPYIINGNWEHVHELYVNPSSTQ